MATRLLITEVIASSKGERFGGPSATLLDVAGSEELDAWSLSTEQALRETLQNDEADTVVVFDPVRVQCRTAGCVIEMLADSGGAHYQELEKSAQTIVEKVKTHFPDDFDAGGDWLIGNDGATPYELLQVLRRRVH
jgi:hypothetical protein